MTIRSNLDVPGQLRLWQGISDSSDDEGSSDSETELDHTLKQPKLAKPGKPDQTTTAGHETETTQMETEQDSELDDVPKLSEMPLCWNLSSDSSDSEDESPPAQPTFNSKPKTITGIELPPKKWKVRNIRKKDTRKLKQIFVGANLNTIKQTLEATTQYASRGAVEGTKLMHQMKSPNPVLNVPRRCESVATDQIYSSTPAIADGTRIAQFFIGTISLFRSVYSLGKTNKNYPQALMDEVRKTVCLECLI